MEQMTVRIIVVLVYSALGAVGNIVTVEEGTIQGTRLVFTDETILNVNRTIDVYRGIPYAEAPIGEKRFSPPEAKRYWSPEIWNGTEFRNACPQTNPNIQSVETGEDCLYLNIFVPFSETVRLRPVMVWFHGGAFVVGTSSQPEFDPTVLSVVGDLIIINVNYRLGIFGFLTTGEGINLLILSYLFSVSQYSNRAVELDTNKAIEDGRSVGRDLNCDYQTSRDFITCLRNKTTDEILEAQRKVVLQTVNVIPFVPTVDGYFLADKPTKLLENGNFKSAKIMIGNNKDEGTLWAVRAYPAFLTTRNPPKMPLAEFREVFPEFVYWYKDPHTADAIEQQYLDWTIVDDTNADHFETFVKLTTDQSFACPANDVARAHVVNGNDVYRYEMTHVPKTSVWTLKKRVGPKWMGATHGEDLPFMFGWGFNDAFDDRYGEQPEDEKKMAVQFMTYWANFANYGNPNGNSSAIQNLPYPEWPKFTLPELEYKQLSKEMENGRALRADGCSFWRNYVPRLATYTGEISDVEKEWRESYYTWKYDDMPGWKTAFNDYKNNDQCEMP
ncbi:acetylcholinesterase-like [Anneissia japonica]|uniref:acetylcholinesterase-like n=1 Tax=Anneissia japonica TaxID=1529436 RepID=UPI0014258597|nr:acetylcholinesterase-like [Anneissia japonica]